MKKIAGIVVGLALITAVELWFQPHKAAAQSAYPGQTSGTSSGSNTGDITLGTAGGLSLSGQALSFGISDAGILGKLTVYDTITSGVVDGGVMLTSTGSISAGPVNVADTITSTKNSGNAIVLAQPGMICTDSASCNYGVYSNGSTNLTLRAGGASYLTIGSSSNGTISGSLAGASSYATASGTGGFTANTTTGNKAVAVAVNGAIIDFGAGANDQASSDGTTVTFASPLTAGAMHSTDTKTVGQITLSTGTGTATVLSGAFCVCNDSTSVLGVRCVVSSTTLTATGTGSDVISYICL